LLNLCRHRDLAVHVVTLRVVRANDLRRFVVSPALRLVAKTKPPPGCIREAADARSRRLQAATARLPNRLRFSFCCSLRGGSLNRRAAVPPRMLCLAFSERKGRS